MKKFINPVFRELCHFTFMKYSYIVSDHFTGLKQTRNCFKGFVAKL